MYVIMDNEGFVIKVVNASSYEGAVNELEAALKEMEDVRPTRIVQM
jgi:translation elongation factor EF-1beta